MHVIRPVVRHGDFSGCSLQFLRTKTPLGGTKDDYKKWRRRLFAREDMKNGRFSEAKSHDGGFSLGVL